MGAPGPTAPAAIDVSRLAQNPGSLWGRSAQEIAEVFRAAGYSATVRQSTLGSQLAAIVEIRGHSQIAQIQVHPGGGRHGGAYIKISTNKGIVKVVDPRTYKPSPGERARIVPRSND